MNYRKLGIIILLFGVAFLSRCTVIGGAIGGSMKRFKKISANQSAFLKAGTPVDVYLKDHSVVDADFVRLENPAGAESEFPDQTMVVAIPDSGERAIPLKDIKFIRFPTKSTYQSCGIGCGAAIDAVMIFWIIIAIYVSNRD